MAVDRSDTERRVAIKKIASAFRDAVDMKRFLRELRYAPMPLSLATFCVCFVLVKDVDLSPVLFCFGLVMTQLFNRAVTSQHCPEGGRDHRARPRHSPRPIHRN